MREKILEWTQEKWKAKSKWSTFHRLPSDAAALAARLSGGSIGRALSMDVAKFLSLRNAMVGVMTSVFGSPDRAALLRTAEEMNDAKNKENFTEMLDILQTLIHDIWRISLGAPESEIINADILPQLAVFAGDAGQRDLGAWLNEIEDLREGLVVNINRKIAADGLFMQMASI